MNTNVIAENLRLGIIPNVVVEIDNHFVAGNQIAHISPPRKEKTDLNSVYVFEIELSNGGLLIINRQQPDSIIRQYQFVVFQWTNFTPTLSASLVQKLFEVD